MKKVLATTSSGAGHYFNFETNEYRRVRENEEVTDWDYAQLRRDGEFLKFMEVSEFQIGKSLAIMLEPLDSEANVTLRYTTPILDFKELD